MKIFTASLISKFVFGLPHRLRLLAMTQRRCIVLAFAFCMILASCGYDRFGDPGFRFEGTEAMANADLAVLQDNYFGTGITITEDLVFEGRVTATDLSGNFYRSFVVEDVTGAAEVYAGVADLHNIYRPGQRVIIRARGLGVDAYNGVMQIGRKVNPYSTYRVEPFGNRPSLDSYVLRDDDVREVVPAVYDLTSLERRYCGRLVRVGGLKLTDEEYGLTWATPGSGLAAPEQGVRTFADNDGNILAVVTSGYASFAGSAVPGGKVALTGILLYGKFGSSRDRFALKIRDLNDVEEIH